MKRRAFLRNSGELAASTVCIGAGLSLLSLSMRPQEQRINGLVTLRPPGSIPEKEFLEKCIRCHRCVDVCPSQAIQISDHGVSVVTRTPYIVPAEHACILCLACTGVCPSGALEKVEKKEDVKIGLAHVDKRLCVAHNGTGVCGACHTACPLKNRAINIDYRTRPTVEDDACTGCGLCEEACPVKGLKAIRVLPLEEVLT